MSSSGLLPNIAGDHTQISDVTKRSPFLVERRVRQSPRSWQDCLGLVHFPPADHEQLRWVARTLLKEVVEKHSLFSLILKMRAEQQQQLFLDTFVLRGLDLYLAGTRITHNLRRCRRAAAEQ